MIMKDNDMNIENSIVSMALFAEMNPEPVLRFDFGGKILQSNPAANQLFGRDDLLNDDITEVLPESSDLDCEGIIEQERIETLHIELNGSHYSFVFRGISSYQVIQVYGFDITDKVKAQNQAESMALFAQKNPAPVFRFDKRGNLLQANDAANQLFEQVCNQTVNIYNFFPQLSKEEIHQLIGENQILSFVEDYNNQYYRFELRGLRELDAVQVYAADITGIVQAQYENEKLSTAVQQSSNSVEITDIDGNLEFVNRAFEEITGYTFQEVKGRNPRFLSTGYHSRAFYREMWDTIKSGRVWKGEFYNRRKDGSTFWEEASIAPIRDNEGVIRNFIAVKEDITEKKKAREQMQSMALFARLNPEPVIRFDPNGIILQANPAANESFSRKSIEGMQIKELMEELEDMNIPAFIEQDQIETIDIDQGDKTYRFILKGIHETGICQIYGSDITERIRAEQKVLQQKNSIDDSIQYASRIQNAVLPSTSAMEQYFQGHFIIFKPRDVVSGDFYWVREKNDQLVLVAADCTGHGVPGAFMSMLGVSFLNEIVNSKDQLKADEILNDLRHLVISTLSQSGEHHSDGMDLSLVIVDRQNMEMQFAGAYNHLYLFREGQMQVIKADRQPIGNYIGSEKPFNNHLLDIQKDDVFYLASDGYADQFDSQSERKFGVKKLKREFLDIHHLSMQKQKEYLEETFEQWKGDHWQLDDVLLIGVRI